MLVLSRKLGEGIMIGDNICLTIIGIQDGRVKIGLSAPKEVQIDRSEVRSARLAAQTITNLGETNE